MIVVMCYVIDMAGKALECGVSPTGRFGGDVHIDDEPRSLEGGDADFIVLICEGR